MVMVLKTIVAQATEGSNPSLSAKSLKLTVGGRQRLDENEMRTRTAKQRVQRSERKRTEGSA